MPDDATTKSLSSGWRWSDDMTAYRIKFVALAAVVAAVAFAACSLVVR